MTEQLIALVKELVQHPNNWQINEQAKRIARILVIAGVESLHHTYLYHAGRKDLLSILPNGQSLKAKGGARITYMHRGIDRERHILQYICDEMRFPWVGGDAQVSWFGAAPLFKEIITYFYCMKEHVIYQPECLNEKV